jgi:hypothetical protein
LLASPPASPHCASNSHGRVPTWGIGVAEEGARGRRWVERRRGHTCARLGRNRCPPGLGSRGSCLRDNVARDFGSDISVLGVEDHLGSTPTDRLYPWRWSPPGVSRHLRDRPSAEAQIRVYAPLLWCLSSPATAVKKTSLLLWPNHYSLTLVLSSGKYPSTWVDSSAPHLS